MNCDELWRLCKIVTTTIFSMQATKQNIACMPFSEKDLHYNTMITRIVTYRLELIFLGKTRATLHNKITRNYYMLDWLWLFEQESTNFTWRTGFITLWNKTITELLCRTRIAFFRNRRFALQDRTITRWLYAGLLGFSLQDNLKTRTNKRGRWLLYSDFDYSLWK